MLANITIEGQKMGVIFVDYTFDNGNDAQFRSDIVDALKNLSLIGCGGYLEIPGPAIYTLLQVLEAFDGKFIEIREGGES